MSPLDCDFGSNNTSGMETGLFGSPPSRRLKADRFYCSTWTAATNNFPANGSFGSRLQGCIDQDRLLLVSLRTCDPSTSAGQDSWGTTAESLHTGSPSITGGDRDVNIKQLANGLANYLLQGGRFVFTMDHEPYLWSNDQLDLQGPSAGNMSDVAYRKGYGTSYVNAFVRVINRIHNRWTTLGLDAATQARGMFAPCFTIGQARHSVLDEFWTSSTKTLATVVDYVAFDIYSSNSSGGFTNNLDPACLSFQQLFEGTGYAGDNPDSWIQTTAQKHWQIWEWGASQGPTGSYTDAAAIKTAQAAWIDAAHSYVVAQAAAETYQCTAMTYFWNSYSGAEDWKFSVNPLDEAGTAFQSMALDPFFGNPVTGTGGVVFAKPALAASGKPTISGTGSIRFTFSVGGRGSNVDVGAGTAAVAFLGPDIEGVGLQTIMGTGAVAFSAPALALSSPSGQAPVRARGIGKHIGHGNAPEQGITFGP